MYYCIMADEIKETVQTAQFTISIRSIDENVDAREEFFGLYKLGNVKSDALVSIKGNLEILGISFSNAWGQWYDVAKNMCGSRTGVSNQILEKNPTAFFIHCFDHALNLAVSDVVRNIRFLKAVF